MQEYEHLLSVQNLHTSFFTDNGEVQAVNGVSFNLDAGKVLGIVGESGSGKSVTAYSIMQILAETGKITEGSVLYKGENIIKWSEKQMRSFRGKCCSIIFQDPMTSLNPVFTVGNQLVEGIRLHTGLRGKAANDRAMEMLRLVGINEPEKRIRQYPYELSGGMFSGFDGYDKDSINVTATDDTTLQFVLSAPCAYIEDLMAFPTFYPVKQSEVEKYDDYATNPGHWCQDAGFISNGAYVCTGWEHDTSMTYEKNPYWYDADKVTVNKLQFMRG